MISFSLIFVLSVFGIFETVYLIRQRKIRERPVCLLHEDCNKVLDSKYNKFFGINNDILGLLFYVSVFIIMIVSIVGIGPQNILILLLKILASTAALFSAKLTFIQWRVIKSWCMWCVFSAITTFLIAIIVFLKF